MRHTLVVIGVGLLQAACADTVRISGCHPIHLQSAEYCDGPVTPVAGTFHAYEWEQCEARDTRTGCTSKVLAEANQNYGKILTTYPVTEWDMREKFYYRLGAWRCPDGVSPRKGLDSPFQRDVINEFGAECDENTPLPFPISTPLASH